MFHIFNVEAFENLPNSLKPSDYVDFLLFLNFNKKIVRVGINKEDVYHDLIRWCNKYNFKFYVSRSGYMYVSYYCFLSKLASFIDDLTVPHALILGLMFGYPLCCAYNVSKIGESNIDKWEYYLFNNNVLLDDFKLIDSRFYMSGYSLISHVPCSTSCLKSLKIAKSIFSIISENINNPSFSRWLYWFSSSYIDNKI